MIYFKMEIGVPQEVTILRGSAAGTFSKYVTADEAEKIAKDEADKAVANQKFKTINGNDIRGEGNIEIVVPTKVSELENDANYATRSEIPTRVSQLENDANYATQSEIPTKVSQLQNDANYATQSELPTTTSELTNNSGFITIADVPTKVSQLENDSNYATKNELPKKTSELTNDSGYITIADVPTKVSEFENDANYATKSEIPTKVSQLQNDANYATQSELPTTTSELTNNSGFITIADVPTKVSELENDAQYVTKSEVPSLTDVPTKVSQLENDSKYISNSNTDGGVNKMWTGTQAEYDAIDPKDNSTIYIVDGKYIYWQGQIIGGGGGTGVAGVSSVNGKTGDVKLKTINNIDLTNSVDILPNIRIVQPFWDEAGIKCGLNFNFKIDESGNETIKSVQPSGFQKIDVGGIKKNRFFQYFQGGDNPQHAEMGLYQAVFTTDAGDSGAHPSQLTYGTINTWGNTHIDNTEDPESEDYFGYYVSFTVISPYTFTKYDVTVLSYYVTAEIENTNTWKIIWKKAN